METDDDEIKLDWKYTHKIDDILNEYGEIVYDSMYQHNNNNNDNNAANDISIDFDHNNNDNDNDISIDFDHNNNDNDNDISIDFDMNVNDMNDILDQSFESLKQIQQKHKQEMKQNYQVDQTIACKPGFVRNPEHLYALWVKKGTGGTDLQDCIAVNYTENFEKNIEPNEQWIGMKTRYIKWKKFAQTNKKQLLEVLKNPHLRENFDVFKALGININDEQQAKYIGYREGYLDNFQICNFITEKDLHNLHQIFHTLLLKNQLFGLQKKSTTTTKRKNKSCKTTTKRKKKTSITENATKTPTSNTRNANLVFISLNAWQSQMEHTLMHLGFESYFDVDYDYVGLIIPISDCFYEKINLKKTSIIIQRHFPWSLINKIKAVDKEKPRTYTSDSDSIIHACSIDHLLFATQNKSQINCTSHYGEIAPQAIKYWGCYNCKMGHGHFSSPMDHLSGGPAQRKGSGSPYITLGNSLYELTNQHFKTQKNKILSKFLAHFYVQSISLISRFKNVNDFERDDYINAIHTKGNNELHDKLKKYLKLQATKYAHKNIKFYNIQKHNTTNDELTQDERKLKHIKERIPMVILTQHISMENAHPGEENNFWISLDATTCKQSNYASTVDSYLSKNELKHHKFTLQQV